MDKETPKINCLKYFASGDNIFIEQLFNYDNLHGGSFKKFICNSSFTYDSEIFNLSLSDFASNYNSTGQFIISDSKGDFGILAIENTFDPDYLNVTVEHFNDALKLTPTFLCDNALNWCIFLDNDLDIFIVWIKDYLCKLFKKHFNPKNRYYYYEPNNTTFLEVAVNRLSYKRDFNEILWTDSVLNNKRSLFA